MTPNRAGPAIWSDPQLRELVQGGHGANRWVVGEHGVFSVRHPLVQNHLEPAAPGIRLSRAGLRGDQPQRGEKAAAHVAVGGDSWSALRAGIADSAEAPADYGVVLVLAHPQGLEVAGAVPRRIGLFACGGRTALVCARATPGRHDEQGRLGDWLQRGPAPMGPAC